MTHSSNLPTATRRQNDSPQLRQGSLGEYLYSLPADIDALERRMERGDVCTVSRLLQHGSNRTYPFIFPYLRFAELTKFDIGNTIKINRCGAYRNIPNAGASISPRHRFIWTAFYWQYLWITMKRLFAMNCATHIRNTVKVLYVYLKATGISAWPVPQQWTYPVR